MRIGEILEEISQDICDNYCKYPQTVRDAVKAGEVTEEDAQEYLTANHCNNCPLVEKL